MADLHVFSDRDLEQALIALKKGTNLIKYSRKSKPRFRAFRLSPDERALIWLSHGEEKSLRLSTVLRITPGQKTDVFRRYKCPEKDHLSFSLIYKNGDRSLDLICKDKAETDVWFAALNSIVSSGQQRNRRTRNTFFAGLGFLVEIKRNRRTRSEIPVFNDGDSAYSGDRPFVGALDFTSGTRGRLSVDWGLGSDAGSEHLNMQPRLSSVDGFRFGGGDGFRVSISSAPSCSSASYGPDDIESLGEVYVWGELWSDGGLPDASDILIPKPLESNLVLDVHQICCGVRHIALVTRQGELFTWGEESGGRLGHGVARNFTTPRLVEFLSITNVDTVSCGEYHSCAVSTSGDLFTWGDGVYNAGILGHGSHASHWIPKRVSGPIEGLQVLSIACGTWHSALITNNGKLFTFGDGTFGALGHGDRKNVHYPKEVQQFGGLKTIKVACGVWHTAAIVEVLSPTPSGASIPSRKLFTWGDGDKYRLGHGNKNTYLLPTGVSDLIDYNFHQIGCGHNFTIALATSGHVFTMGSTAHGQLGNPQADGKVPCLVQDKLVGEFVEEIACGTHHAAVLTSRTELYTWGKGANGRLGHGDVEDRKIPTLVEALKDRHVKNIACGSNFTASICIHKWVSGADQSVCSGCRLAFGFTRKRHNCYNCGLVHCHSCSSKKAVRAALAPTPSKPHRVCDSCYNKLKAPVTGASFQHKRSSSARRSIDSFSGFDRPETKSSRILLPPTTEPVKYLEVKSQRSGGKSESVSMVRASQIPSFQLLKDVSFPTSFSVLQTPPKPNGLIPSQPPPVPNNSARPASSFSRRPCPARAALPPRGVVDSLRKSNELLSQEVSKLQNHLKHLKEKYEVKEEETEKWHKTAEEATLLPTDQCNKCKVATEVIKTFTAQMKGLTEKLPPELSENENFKAMQSQVLAFIDANESGTSESHISLPMSLQPKEETVEDTETNSTKDCNTTILDASVIGDLSQADESAAANNQTSSSDTTIVESDPVVSDDCYSMISTYPTLVRSATEVVVASSDTTECVANQGSKDGVYDANEPTSSRASEFSTGQGVENETAQVSKQPLTADMRSMSSQSMEARIVPLTSDMHSMSNQSAEARIVPRTSSGTRREASKENTEQYTPGVHITYIQLRDGTKVYKRVKFSQRRFASTQAAAEWWKKNRKQVFRKYIPPSQVTSTVSASSPTTRENPFNKTNEYENEESLT